MGALAAFILVWVRTSTLLLATPPVFGGPGVPPLSRLGLSALLAGLLWPLVVTPGGESPGMPVGAPAGGPAWMAWAAAIGVEVVTGLVMAFGVNALFGAVLLAGQLVDLPMGLSVVNVIDPTLEQPTPVIGQFHMLLAVLIFFGIDGHHAMLSALAESLRAVPPGTEVASAALLEAALDVFARAFVLGVRLAAPVMAALFLADVALAVVARAVPQLNIFVVGFPAKILLGFVALLLGMPATLGALTRAFGWGGTAWDLVGQLIRAMAPSR